MNKINMEVGSDSLTLEEYEKMIVDGANRVYGNEGNYNCPKCLNKGYTYEYRGGLLCSVICNCSSIRKSNRLLLESGLMESVKTHTFENFIARENWQIGIKNRCIEFTRNFKKGSSLCLLGQSGAGKTHLCTAVCGELIKAGHSLRYVMWRDIVNKLQANTYNDAITSQITNSLNEMDILYIDDLFKLISPNQMQKTKELEIAFKILNNAEIFNKSVIISSECTLNELQKLDEAIAGRIIKMTTSRYLLQISRSENKNYRYKDLEVF